MTDNRTEYDEDTRPQAALAGSEGSPIHPGGRRGDLELGGLVPPYEGRQAAGPGKDGPGYGRTEGHLAFDPAKVDVTRPGREISDEERDGMEATDPEPKSAHGGGEDRDTAYGNGDFTDLGTQGQTDRPVGGSEPEQRTGVDAQDGRT